MKPKEILPRDRAGRFSLPSETGAIKYMVGLGAFLEIHTVHATYRVKTADQLDPARTKPDMPWSRSVHASVGSSNPIVARILIQCAQAANSMMPQGKDRELVIHNLHGCKEEVLICESAFNKLKPAYAAALEVIEARKVPVQQNMIECPSLPGLQDEAKTFLTSAKRALQFVGEVFNTFFAPDGQKPKISNGNFSYAIKRLENSQTGNPGLLEYLRGAEPRVKHFVELRNGFEHQSGHDFTEIENFRPSAKGIVPPCWRRGTLINECPVIEEMQFFIQFVIELCEHVFFFGLVQNFTAKFGFGLRLVQLTEKEIDLECPMRYRLTLG
jgi:hypothetical protein